MYDRLTQATAALIAFERRRGELIEELADIDREIAQAKTEIHDLGGDKMDVIVNDKTADLLREIAMLHDCPVETAAQTVLDRYTKRTKREVKTAQGVADKAVRRAQT